MAAQKSIRFLPWWVWLLAINLFLVVVTVAHHKLVLTDSIHFYLRQVDLAIEMNFAAWWSGVLLLGLGLLAYEIFSSEQGRSQWAWLSLAIAFTALSIDEIGSIHERIEDWLPEQWLPVVDPYLPVAIVGLLLIPYPLVQLAQSKATRKTAMLLLVGFLLLSSIAFQERMEGYINWGDWWSVRLGLEEGTELLGMFCCYCALVNHTWQGHRVKNLCGVLPNPLRMKHFPTLATGGLLLHLGVWAALLWQKTIDATAQTSFSEHTLVWYPLALAIALGLAAFWQYRHFAHAQSKGDRSLSWLALSAYAIAYSAVVPYVIPLTTDKADAFLSAYVYPFYLLQLLLAFAFFALIFLSTRSRLKARSFHHYFTLAAMALLVFCSGLAPYSMAVRYAMPALFTLLLFRLFLIDVFEQRRKR